MYWLERGTGFEPAIAISCLSANICFCGAVILLGDSLIRFLRRSI